jgi:hypothetical protein
MFMAGERFAGLGQADVGADSKAAAAPDSAFYGIVCYTLGIDHYTMTNVRNPAYRPL